MRRGFVIGDRGLGTSGDTHPEWMMAHAIAGPFLIVAASAVGQIHFHRNLPRDDAVTVRCVGPWVAAVVADGVGSRPFSRFGASYTTEALSAYLLQPLSALKLDVEDNRTGAAQPGTAQPVPPPIIEATKFDPLIPGRSERGGGWEFIKSQLGKWNQKSKTADREVTRSGDLMQATGTTGWWLDRATNQPPSGASTGVKRGGSPTAVSQTEPLGQSSTENISLTGLMRQAFERTHLGLREQAKNLRVELADLGCTALSLLLNVETCRGVVGQVGDGAILGMTSHGKVHELVHAPDTGDPQSTYTLTRPHFGDYLALQVIEPVPADPLVAFYLMTDGLSGDLLYAKDADAVDKWAQAVGLNLRRADSQAAAAQGMLNWLASYQVKGSWDDRTLVAITQLETSDAGSESVAEQPQLAGPTDGR